MQEYCKYADVVKQHKAMRESNFGISYRKVNGEISANIFTAMKVFCLMVSVALTIT